MVWRRWLSRRRNVIRKNIILGSGELSITDSTMTNVIMTDTLSAFVRHSEPYDQLPRAAAERIERECPTSSRLDLDTSRRLLAFDENGDDLALYAVKVSPIGLAYILTDPSTEPQFITRLRNKCYSVTHSYRVRAGELFDVLVYGVVSDGVDQITVRVKDRDHLARIGQNGYYVRYQSLGTLERLQVIRCVLTDGLVVSENFAKEITPR